MMKSQLGRFLYGTLKFRICVLVSTQFWKIFLANIQGSMCIRLAEKSLVIIMIKYLFHNKTMTMYTEHQNFYFLHIQLFIKKKKKKKKKKTILKKKKKKKKKKK